MEATARPPVPLAGAAKRVLHRLFAIGENRLQLLAVEVQEERDRIMDIFVLAVVMAAIGMLCALVWSAALVIILWPYSHFATLLILGGVYAVIAIVLGRRMLALRETQTAFSGTIDQFRKDRACLEEN